MPKPEEMTMHDPIIQIRGLRTRYGRQEIIRGIDLDIYPRETLVILGRSGCGKSTLLRHIVGLQRPTQGQILVKEVDMAAAAGEERERLWQQWRDVNPELDGYAARRTTETPVVVLEPLEAPST